MIRIAREALATLRSHCAAAAPEEACGLLVGEAGRILRAEPAENVAEDRRRRFEVDPRLLLRLHRELRGGPHGLVGVYHSHPEGRAEPSPVDLAKALDPELLWLIVGADGETRLWSIVEGAAREIAWTEEP